MDKVLVFYFVWPTSIHESCAWVVSKGLRCAMTAVSWAGGTVHGARTSHSVGERGQAPM